jgi:PAS domain S-box-containing protein
MSAPMPIEPSEADPLINHRVLVIDDTPSLHEDYQRVLTASQRGGDIDNLEAELFGTAAKSTSLRPVFQVTAAFQGQEGFAKAEAAVKAGQPFALAFVDMRMPPGWDGVETTMRILAADPDIQVVICTAFSDYSWEELSDQLGGTDRVLILKKPFDNLEVAQMATTLCRKWSLSRIARNRMEILESLVEKRVFELATSNLRLSTLIKVSPVGIFVLDRDGKVASWNPAAEGIFGWSSDEVVGRQPPSSILTHLQVFLQSDKEAPTSFEPRRGADFHMQRKDGVGIEIATYTAQVSDEAGAADGYIVVVADISARKQIEEELRRAKAAAEEATHAKSDFLATMSHEIRTPMNGVLGMAELLLSTPLNAEQKDFAQVIYQSGEALLAIINDILDFSKIEAGMLSLDPISFDLQNAVSQVVELLASRAEAKGIELIYHLAADLPTLVVGDAGRIRQILTNLVGNAVKFTKSGHVFVEVTSSALADGRTGVRMAVHDTGIGIPEDKQRLLFQKFSQADASTTRQFGGTGLGLAISKQLAELMGGTISVVSRPGQGSTFTVELPLAADPDPAGKPPSPVDLMGTRVVVGEPNAVARRVLEEQLGRWGCVPLPAGCAAEVVKAVEDGMARPGRMMCIIEAHLPGSDPFALASDLRRRSSGRDVPLILLTTMGQRGDSKKAAAAGFAAYLTKPVRMSDLRDALAALYRNGGQVGEQLVTRHSLAEARGQTSSGSRRRLAVQAAPALATGPQILVVEDSAVNSLIVRRILESLGCKAVVVGTGAEAVSLCLSTRFDLVFMDYYLAGMDGVEATRLIRSQESGRRTPILAMSASVLDQDRALFSASGMDGILSKPVRSEEIKNAIATWVTARPANAGGNQA